jgi:hypothetical protein
MKIKLLAVGLALGFPALAFAAESLWVSSQVSFKDEKLLSQSVLMEPNSKSDLEVAGENGFHYSVLVEPAEEGTAHVKIDFRKGDSVSGPDLTVTIGEESSLIFNGLELSITVE